MELMSVEDINASYVHTWLGYTKDNGEVQPCYVDGAADLDSGEIGMWFKPFDSSTGGMLRRKRVSMLDDRIEWEHPDSGYYPVTNRTAFKFERGSGRQYRRGVRENMIRVEKYGCDLPTFAHVLYYVYNQKPFVSWREARELDNGEPFCAVMSRLVILRRSSRYAHPVMYLRDRPAAELVDGEELVGANQEAINWLVREL